MKDTPSHLKALEEMERECIPVLVEVLSKAGLEAVRYVLWASWYIGTDFIGFGDLLTGGCGCRR